jgi:glycosyltransferase involved in cell wall biosynthesis
VPALLALPDAPEIVALGGDPATLPAGVSHVPAPLHPPTNAGWVLAGLPRAASRAGVDLIHAPAYTGPIRAAVPTVVTVHDVSYERHPEWNPYRRDRLRRAFYRASARAAAHVLTVSEFSAGEIAALYGIPRERMTVTPHGVSGTFAPADPSRPAALPSGVRAPYVLHVGDLHERRNLAVVIDAIAEARRHFGALPTLSLVLAGVDRGIGESLGALAASAGAADAVLRLGVVSETQLHMLYRGAMAVVYPSLYEGFGLPVLEAMASGVPVIASRAASIPEVLGDAGLLLDGADTKAWTDALMRVVSDEELRGRMGAAGLARAAAFTWERSARLTLDVYRRVAEYRGGRA